MNEEDRLYLAEVKTQRLGKTVSGIWQFFFFLGLASFIFRIVLSAGRGIWDVHYLGFLWFGFGLLTTHAVLKRRRGRHVLFGLLGMSVLAVLALLANAVLFEEFEHKASSSLFFLLVLGPALVPFGMLCRLVFRMRNGGDPAEAYPSPPFLDQMECLLQHSHEQEEAGEREKSCGKETS